MHRLSFCSVIVVSKDIIEVIPGGGVDITLEMAEEFLSFLKKEVGSEVSVILNKATKYSYQFDALVKLSVSDRIIRIAVVAYDDLSKSMSEYMEQRFNQSGKDIEIFTARDEALSWIQKNYS